MTGGTPLTTGGSYIALIEQVTNPTGGVWWTGVGLNTYPLGSLFDRFYNPLTPTSSPSDPGAWNGYAGAYDLALRATFGPGTTAAVTPEPATLALLATGLAGIAAVRRRKRTK